MKKKNSGFTLVELLAVIVILSIIITIASSGVIAIMNKSRKNMAKEVQANLEETALTYALEHNHLETCSLSLSEEIYEDKNINNLESLELNKNCFVRVRVDKLISEGLFEDSRGFCKKDGVVIVYRYSYRNEYHEILSEYKTFTSEDICNN